MGRSKCYRFLRVTAEIVSEALGLSMSKDFLWQHCVCDLAEARFVVLVLRV